MSPSSPATIIESETNISCYEQGLFLLKVVKDFLPVSHTHLPFKPIYLPTFTLNLALWLGDHQEEEAEEEEANSRSSLVVVRTFSHAY
jgi:hypothetical protein